MSLAFSVHCLPQCIDLFLFPLDGVPQQLLVLPLLLAELTQQPENAKSAGYSAESVLARGGSFVTLRCSFFPPRRKPFTHVSKTCTRISKNLTKKRKKEKKKKEKRISPQGLSPEVPQLLTEGTLGAEHHIQGVTKAGGERVLEHWGRLLWVRWLPQLVWDGSYRCVRLGVFFRNAVVHFEGGLELDFELWDTQRRKMGWMEARRRRRITIWMKRYLVGGR